MSFRPEVFDYLAHFRATVPIGELYDRHTEPDLLGLRHDVDHSLDLALELAWVEFDRGLRGTYYVLSGHDYTRDDLFIDRCLKIQELGHEIGLHNDLITRWIREDEPPGRMLDAFLNRLREAGISVRGMATHGDNECYLHGYMNSWLFAETRPTSAGTWNAEGLEPIQGERAIESPASGEIEVGGRRLELWGMAMADAGLDYEAHRVPVDRYFTDSGGEWRRSPDPLDDDVTQGRVQVLMHPEWWAGRRRIFFLSTARSGSKWLANLVDRSTPAIGRHELSLNHRYEEGELREEKRTGEDFRSFIGEREIVRARLREVAAWAEQRFEDFVEANVYLAHCLDELREIYPEAVFVHLYRDGRDVVRSLMNRSWYDTPDDDRHPDVDVEGWASATQLERCCWYWARTNATIATVADHSLSFERATSDPSFLRSFLEALGLPTTLPEVFDREHERRINEGYSTGFATYDRWADDEREAFDAICGPMLKRLGYPAPEGKAEWTAGPATDLVPTVVLHHLFGNDQDLVYEYGATRCSFRPTTEGLVIDVPQDAGGHATVLFGGGKWGTVDTDDSLAAVRSHYYRLEVDVRADAELGGALHVLFFDEEGRPLRTPHRRSLRAAADVVRLSFWPPPSAARFTFGLWFHDRVAGRCTLRSVRLLSFAPAGTPPTPSWPAGSRSTLIDHDFRGTTDADAYRAIRCQLDGSAEGLRVHVGPERGGHATIHLGDGTWARPDTDGLVPAEPGRLYELDVDAEMIDGLSGSVHALFYDRQGAALPGERTGLVPGRNFVRLRFRPPPNSRWLTFGLYFPDPVVGSCLVRSARLAIQQPHAADEGRVGTDEFYREQEGFGYPEDYVTRWIEVNVELPDRGRVLDLCCGDGIWSKGIRNLRPALELFGIDISVGGIEKARELLGSDERHFVVGDAEERLPFDPGSFDLVFARGPGLYNQHDMDRPATIEVIERWHEHLTAEGRFYSIFASTPELMGTYTPPDAVKLPYNRYPRSTATVDFRGGKYHHTTESFLVPFEKAANVQIVSYRFEGGLHVLVTRRVGR